MRRIATGRIDKALEKTGRSAGGRGPHIQRARRQEGPEEAPIGAEAPATTNSGTIHPRRKRRLSRGRPSALRQSRRRGQGRDARRHLRTLHRVPSTGWRRGMDRRAARGARPGGGVDPRRRRLGRPRGSDEADRGGSRAGRDPGRWSGNPGSSSGRGSSAPTGGAASGCGAPPPSRAPPMSTSGASGSRTSGTS